MEKSSFQFSNPTIVDVKFSKNQNFDNGNKSVVMKNSFDVAVFKKSSDSAAVELTLKINGDEEQTPFSLSLKIGAAFHWSGNIGNVDTFLRRNAPALLVSYARPFVTSLTTAANLPPYYLPFIDFTK